MRSAFFRIILVMGILSFLAGCATEKNIPMPEQFWQSQQGKIAVTETKAIVPALYKTGAQGVIDIAINSAMTRKVNNRIAKSDESWYQSLPHEFSQKLRQRNKTTVESDSLVNDDKKTYQTYAVRIGANKLLIIKLEAFGAVRHYYAFIPLSAPKAYCQLSGELRDVVTNKVIWRHRVTTQEEINGNWDQPPLYPNVTTAIQLAASDAREELLDSFFSGH